MSRRAPTSRERERARWSAEATRRGPRGLSQSHLVLGAHPLQGGRAGLGRDRLYREGITGEGVWLGRVESVSADVSSPSPLPRTRLQVFGRRPSHRSRAVLARPSHRSRAWREGRRHSTARMTSTYRLERGQLVGVANRVRPKHRKQQQQRRARHRGEARARHRGALLAHEKAREASATERERETEGGEGGREGETRERGCSLALLGGCSVLLMEERGVARALI